MTHYVLIFLACATPGFVIAGLIWFSGYRRHKRFKEEMERKYSHLCK